MQGRTPISSMDLKTCMNNLRKNPRFTEEMIQLVQDDLNFGLTKEETEEYTRKKIDYEQMKVYSKCLRNGYDDEVKRVVLLEGLSAAQMTVALEFYEKGVALETIKKVVTKTENTPFIMKKLFKEVLSKMQEAGDVIGEEIYAKDLFEKVKEVVSQIEHQEQWYEQLNIKLQELQTTKEDVEVQNNLLQQLSEKDGLLEQQQNELNEARTTIVRLRNEMDVLRKGMSKMENPMEERNSKKEMDVTKPEKEKNNIFPSYPEYSKMMFQAIIVDEKGRVLQMVPIERTRKANRSILTELFSRIHFKKKMDIVSLVAKKELTPKQLIQVRKGIEKGLSEKQLMVLINNQIAEEQMEEIINIAVYENIQREG